MDFNEAARPEDPEQITQQLREEQTRIFRRLAEISYQSPETPQLLQRLAQISEEDPDDSTDSSNYSSCSSDSDVRQQARCRAYRRPGEIPLRIQRRVQRNRRYNRNIREAAHYGLS